MKLNEFIIVHFEDQKTENYETNVFIGSSAIDDICKYIFEKLEEEEKHIIERGEKPGEISLAQDYITTMENIKNCKEVLKVIIRVGGAQFGDINIECDVYGEGYMYQLNKDTLEDY